jgi:hypothetical protein
VAGNRCAIYLPGCDGGQLRARHGQAPQVRKYNWRWRAAFTIVSLFRSSLHLVNLPRKLQLLQQCLTIPSLSLSLLLVNLPRKLQLLQHSFLDVEYPFLRQQQQLPVCNFAPRFDHVSESES